MNVVKSIYLCLSIIVLSSKLLLAHNPEISTIVIADKGENIWIMQIRTALTAIEFEINNKYGEDTYKSPEEFNELIISHLLEEINVSINNQKLTLEKGLVKLGHETSVTFVLKDVPKEIKTVEVRNTSFTNVYRNRSTLFVLKEGFEQNKFELSHKNQHKVFLKVKNNRFHLSPITSGNVNQKQNSIKYILICGIIVAIITLLYKIFNPNKMGKT